MPVQCTCQTCGKTFSRKPSQVAKYSQHYCSRECRRTSVKVACAGCGVMMSRQPSSLYSGAMYCSRDCRWTHERVESVTLTCAYCGASYQRKPSNVYKSKYCSMSCRGKARSGPLAGNWRGGRHIERRHGYVKIFVPGRGQVLEHRYVMEQHLGRPLHPDEHIHHLNRDKTDNRIENLVLTSNSEHQYLHRGDSRLKGRWSYRHDACVICGTTESRHAGKGRCKRCDSRMRRAKHRPPS